MNNPNQTLDTPKAQGVAILRDSGASAAWGSGIVGTVNDPIVFYAGPATGKIWSVDFIIARMNQQTTETADLGYFWRNGATLTNGILVRKAINGILDHYIINDAIKTAFEMNMSFHKIMSKIYATSPYTTGNLDINFQWIAKYAGGNIILDGSKNERIEWVIQDTMPNAGNWFTSMHYTILKG